MKKIIPLLILMIILSGCSDNSPKIAEPKNYITIAEPFDNELKTTLQITDDYSCYNFENLESYIREDGNRVVYLYSSPVEKSCNIIEEYTDCFIAQGDYSTKTIPMSFSDGNMISISDNYTYMNVDIDNIETEGELIEHENIFGKKKDAVLFKDAFGTGIDYYCYVTAFGINTEIVINERNEKNTFQLKLQLPDLFIDTNSPDYILLKSDVDIYSVESILYTPLLCDTNGKWSYLNSVNLIEKDNLTNTYTVEYTIDKEFLNDDTTEYPIVMNQSIYLYKSKQPDTSAYENTGDEPGHYLSPYLLLGDNTLKGEGWTYIRYETLDILDIDPDKIISANYIFHTLLDSNKEVKIGAYAVTNDWCSINTRWFNRPSYDEEPVSEVIVKETDDYMLDITPLFTKMMLNKKYQNAKYSVRNGFLIKSDTIDSNLLLASGDNGLFSPVLEIVLSE